MTIKSGFFNSQNNDQRLYDAEDMNNILSGVIKNGVLYSVGQTFAQDIVSGAVRVYSGKAWMDGHWICIDDAEDVTLDQGPNSGYRWDVVYLEINDNTRIGSIKTSTGTASPSPNPQKPNMSTSSGEHKLPLCYVYRKYNTSPQRSDLINLVGTNACPYVTFSAQDGTGAQIEEILNRLDNLNRASFGIYVGENDPSEMASQLNTYDIYIHIQS